MKYILIYILFVLMIWQSQQTQGISCNATNGSAYWCSIGEYCDPNASICKICAVQNCAVCQNDGLGCSSCKEQFFLDNITQTCSACAIGCLNCTNNGAGKCDPQGCEYGWGYNNITNTCQLCNDSSYYDENQKICVNCTPPCIFCNAQNCLACPPSYVINGTNCSSCATGCLNCTNNGAGKCDPLGCQYGWGYNNITNTCQLCNGSSYYDEQQQICVNCTSPCILCNSTNCLLCPTSYFINGTACNQCPYQCKNCSDNSSCQQCISGTYWMNASNTCDICNGSTFYNSTTQTCDNCPNGCLSCQNSSYCTSCNYSYYLDSQSKLCQSCPANCWTCNSSTSCQNCTLGRYWIVTYNTCDICNGSTFYNSTTQTCDNCSNGCLSCQNSSYCTQCNLTYYYFNQANHSCNSCPANCDYCYDNQSCFRCSNGYLWMNDTKNCSTCNGSTYYDTSLQKCMPCMANCQNCSNGQQCKQCNTGYYWDVPLQQCIKSTSYSENCISGYYWDNNQNFCVKCAAQYCQICSPLNSSICLMCQKNYFLNNTYCIPYPCSPGYQFDPIKDNCPSPCSVPNCAICTIGNLCQQCLPNFGLKRDQNQCINITGQCPPQYYWNFDVGSCLPCINNCQYCSDGGSCDKCMDNYTLSTDKTVCGWTMISPPSPTPPQPKSAFILKFLTQYLAIYVALIAFIHFKIR